MTFKFIIDIIEVLLVPFQLKTSCDDDIQSNNVLILGILGNASFTQKHRIEEAVHCSDTVQPQP